MSQLNKNVLVRYHIFAEVVEETESKMIFYIQIQVYSFANLEKKKLFKVLNWM